MKTKLTTPISDATVKPAPTAPKSMVPAARAEIHVKEVSSRSNLRSVSEEGPSSNASRNGAGKGPFMMDTREDNLSDSRNIQSAVPVAPSSVSHPSAASGSNPPTASRPRQPPKPIAANLFIPKKPVVRIVLTFTIILLILHRPSVRLRVTRRFQTQNEGRHNPSRRRAYSLTRDIL